MQVTWFTTLSDLAPLAADWDGLARGVPFREWPWLWGWWRHYGLEQAGPRQASRLYVLVVRDATGVVRGIAPWYWQSTPTRGRVLRFLGLGEVCADYLSVLCEPQYEEPVAEALAVWLSDANRSSDAASPAWDLLELTGVDAQDAMVRRLAEKMASCGHMIHCRPGPNCWRIALPDTWDQYLRVLSKRHRRQLRRMQEEFLDSGRVTLHQVEQRADLERGRAVLIDLHQRRWQALGEPGCFASARYTAFHREVMAELLERGQLCLAWAELDGLPVVAEYHISSKDVMYAYQTGMDQTKCDCTPGRLGNMVTIRRAIERGFRAFDFLRGDELYKAQWQATPRESVEYRIVAPRSSARLRHALWCAGSRVKRWVKTGLKQYGV